ncbi:hypothetical protein CC2G_000522 [Coprinopsis cinerea AmutBmut pab1-1]|nr:hypothetical protein CC2G_000522 [Coprinopsis cinerea AmutBmut pab1-1]
MDQQQGQGHHNMGDEHGSMPGGYFYGGQDEQQYNLAYNPGMAYNPAVAQHAPQTRSLDLHQQPIQQYHNHIPLLPAHQYQANVFPGSSPHGALPVTGTPPPPSPDLNMYDHPLSPPVSGSETSADGLYHHSNSSGANSPVSSRANSLVHRTARYNPTPSPTSSAGRRRGRSHDSDEEDNMGVAFVENLAHSRKEATRRQRIEAEQRRRDELRDGYARLKEVLPISNQKSSKVSLLERATNHIIALEKANKELEDRIAALEAEMQRLRGVNEKISLSANNTPSPAHPNTRPLSPPPEGQPDIHRGASLADMPPVVEDLNEA